MVTQLEHNDSFWGQVEFLSDKWEFKVGMFNSRDSRRKFIMGTILDEYVINGRGATSINNQLVKRYGDKNNPKHEWRTDGSIPPKITIQRAIESNKEEDTEYDIDKCKVKNPQLYPYLRKMQLINVSVLKTTPKLQKITTLFAKSIERCLYSFNDPLGEKVDLMAQWVVAREYYIRDRVRNKFTADLDAILDYTPWLDIDRPATETLYYSEGAKNPQDLTPRLTHVMPVGTIENRRFKGEISPDSLSFCVYAQLGLPWSIIFFDRDKNEILAMNIPTDEERKKYGLYSPEQLRKIPLAKPLIDLRNR